MKVPKGRWEKMGGNAHNKILLASQAMDNYEVSKKMNIEVEELFAPWVIEKTKNLFFLSPRFVAWPLELGLGTHNLQLGILLELVEGEKMGFHPCVYTQNTQFFQENQIMDEN